MDDNTQRVDPNAGTGDPDAAKYAELARELGVDAPGEGGDELGSGQQPQPESQPEPQPEPEPEDDFEKRVAKATVGLRNELSQERATRKAAEDQIKAWQQVVEDARSRREQKPGKDDGAPEVPDVQEDPIGHYNAVIGQLREEIAQLKSGGQQTGEQLQAWQQHQQLMGYIEASESEIRDPKSQSHKADYDDAIGHLANLRIKQLNRLYPDDSSHAVAAARQQGFQTPQQLKRALLDQDGNALAVQALQLGMSPAQFYYDLALDSGYAPKKPNGAGIDQQSLADKAKQQLNATKRGRNASMSISGDSGGRKGPQDMSITDLADLFVDDPDMADKVWDQMARSGRLG